MPLIACDMQCDINMFWLNGWSCYPVTSYFSSSQIVKNLKSDYICDTDAKVYMYRVGQKWTVLRVDNIATVNGRKACDMSKVLEFCLEKV